MIISTRMQHCGTLERSVRSERHLLRTLFGGQSPVTTFRSTEHLLLTAGNLLRSPGRGARATSSTAPQKRIVPRVVEVGGTSLHRVEDHGVEKPIDDFDPAIATSDWYNLGTSQTASTETRGRSEESDTCFPDSRFSRTTNERTAASSSSSQTASSRDVPATGSPNRRANLPADNSFHPGLDETAGFCGLAAFPSGRSAAPSSLLDEEQHDEEQQDDGRDGDQKNRLDITSATGSPSSVNEQLAEFARRGIIVDPKFGENAREPRRCLGCGAMFQCSDNTKPGYVPAQTKEKYNGGRKKLFRHPKGVPVDAVPSGADVLPPGRGEKGFKLQTKLLVCQRCFRLQNYKSGDPTAENSFYAANEEVGGALYKHPNDIVNKIISKLKPGSIILHVVDLMDFESSLVPELFIACRNKQLPVLFVLNKADCLPVRANKDRVKLWARQMARHVRNVHVEDVMLVSSTTSEGFGELEARLKYYLADPHAGTDHADGGYAVTK